MTARQGLISYDGLPRSHGGAHGLGRVGVVAAWQSVRSFLDECTTAGDPVRAWVSINETPADDPALAAELQRSARAALNTPSRPLNRQDLGEVGIITTWKVPGAATSAAVQWLATAGPPANALGGLATISFDFEFRLKRSDGIELPWQSSLDYFGQAYDGYGVLLGESGCRLSLAARSALSLVLFLPFEEPSAEFLDYAAHLQRHLPLRFSQRHWKHWRLMKKGTAYSSRRIPLEIP